MVFSVFKKKEERMAPPKAVRPPSAQNPAAAPAARAPEASGSKPLPSGKPAPTPESDDLESLDFTGIQLEEEKDPVDSAAEEAAIAYANEDLAHAESVLRDSIKAFMQMPSTEVLWLMLFDLYRLTGKREPFTAIELEYAKRYEKQPPAWINASGKEAGPTSAASGAILFKGDLVASNAAGFESTDQAIQKAEKPRLDIAKVKLVDAAGASRLLEFVQRGKKNKRPLELIGVDSLIKLLDPAVKSGDRNQSIWQLLLDCHQRQGKQEVFDDLAIEFAVTFELSPPAYEAPPAVAKKPPALAAKPAEKPGDDAFYLGGEMRGGGRIDGLEDFLKGHEKVVIDMSAVSRIDFACAGVLFTALHPCCMSGISVTIRHPNYLVAALLKTVGIADVATIVNARH